LRSSLLEIILDLPKPAGTMDSTVVMTAYSWAYDWNTAKTKRAIVRIVFFMISLILAQSYTHAFHPATF